jgi:hypothetical protein
MPSTALRDFLAAYPPRVRALAVRARDEILKIHPGAVEKVWPGWKVVGYGIGPSMAEMVVGVAPLKARIGLYFSRGSDLPDPDEILEGAGKKGRNVPIADESRLASRPVRGLLRSAFRLARESRGPAPASAAKRSGTSAATSTAPTSDEAVQAKTGRTWDEWVAALDDAGARGRTHREIVALLSERFDVGPWWRQMVAVGYERATGARAPHQTTSGYQVGGSRTVAVPVGRLWRAWTDARTRARWLPDATFTVRKATEPKSLRITWGDGSDLQVNFYPKGDEKSVVQVDQRRLPDAAAVERMRAYWRERLDRMRAVVEG